MKSQRIELLFVGGREGLAGAAGIVFIEWIVGSLHATVEKVAGIGALAEIGQFRIAAIHREIGGRRGVAARDQPGARAREAKEVKEIGLRAQGAAKQDGGP